MKLKEQVKSMHKELKKVSKERDHMKESRDKELKKLVSFCNNLNSRIQRINNNFEGSEEDEQKYSSRRKSLAKNNRDAKL